MSEFQAALEIAQREAELKLRDAADCGSVIARNARQNLKQPHRSALALQGAFEKIPAIIAGAGPSLQLDEKMKERALVFAGGNAMRCLPFRPHFGAAIDPEAALKLPFPDIPFCFQARVHPDTLSSACGTPLLAPDSHFSWVNWIGGEEELFDGGWTVGNFLTALALHWGCDPIIFVGMDYCYQGSVKYADGVPTETDGLIAARNRKGERVWTQNDWLMAIRWTEEKARAESSRTFLDAGRSGIGFALPVQTREMPDLPLLPDLQERIDAALQNAPLQPLTRWEEWKESLRRCGLPTYRGEPAYQHLLEPLWRIWRPLIESTLDRVSDNALHINEMLFYSRVIQEHLHVLD